MYRVIIADDEPIIRRGLRETIEWDALGLEISGEASNGAVALELIKANTPHILITDIKMPEIDGIELIREIRALGLNLKIIILSGYCDYAFLKEAIKLGVESYLLKPIDNDELVSNLADAVNNIEREVFERIQQYQGSELLKSNVLNRLVTNGISIKEFGEKASFLNISLEAETYVCAVCIVDFMSGDFGGDEKLTIFSAQNICGELVRDDGLSFINDKGQIVILFMGGDKETVNAVLNASKNRISEYLGISLLAGVGMKVNSLDDIWKSYLSASKCLDYGVFGKNEGVVWFDNITPSDPEIKNIDINYILIEKLLKLGKRDELSEYTENLFNTISEAAVSVEYIRSFIMRLTIETISIFKEAPEMNQVSPHLSSFNYSELLKFRSVKDFKQWYNRLCDEMLAETGRLRSKSGGLIKHIISYIEEHYNEGPTIKQVADIYNLNTSYLGQLFKKETGETFTFYVNKCRIQKAKELLSDPRLKVYEIAERVGFTDYHYFLKIFKKITGVNPTEIRTYTDGD